MGGASLLLAFLGRVKYRNINPRTRGTAATGDKSTSVSIVELDMLMTNVAACCLFYCCIGVVHLFSVCFLLF